MRPAGGAIKKKTIDEAVSCQSFLPVFNSDISEKQPVNIESTPNRPTEKVPEIVRLPESPPADTSKKSRRAHLGHLSTPSISHMLKGEHLSEVAEPGSSLAGRKENAREHPFDAGQLVTAWKSFAESVDAGQLKSALSVREPLLLDNFCVEYNLDNEVQRQRIILDLKPKLLAHLHRELHNELVTIEFNVTENRDEIMNKPYTDQEKFNTLAAKYPVLSVLKQRFGLDFE